MLKRSAAIQKLLSAFFAAVMILTLAAAAQTNNVSPPLRARQLNGMKVEDSDGHKAGTVRNLVLNLNNGNLRYVVIGSGGYLGMRATSRLAPVEIMSAATAKDETLAINATTPQWRQAPPFKYSNLSALADRERAGEIARYFRISKTNSTGKQTAVSLSKTGREPSPAPRLEFASDIMGMHVVNQKREKMGEVVDLLVSFGEPRPAFVIISSGRLFHHDHQYAVPLNTLTLSDNKLLWNVDAAALPNAPEFDLGAWTSRGRNISPQVYRYLTPAD
jgi:sporulation protein YlmC with PRC-barrel domain